MLPYLDLAQLGKTSWWRFLLAVLLILFVWQILGSLPYVFLIAWTFLRDPQASISSSGLVGLDPLENFVALMLGSACLVLGVFLAVRLIHQRRLLTLVTPARSITWQRIFQGFAAWFLLSGLFSFVEALLYPGRYTLTFDPARFVPFVFLALIFVPLQTSGEELFFRGYILQGLGLRLRKTWMLCIASGVLFMLPHFLNPEASVNYYLMGLYYFLMGAFLALVTLQDGRLELALGVHAANNLFSFLIANSTITVMPSPSLFTVTGLDVVYSLAAELIGVIIFLLVFRLGRSNAT